MQVDTPPPGQSAVVTVEDSFWDDTASVSACLREPVPRIPPWFGYDRLGSQLFESITELPSYYLTRVERDLLRRHRGQIAEALGCPRIAELGSGSAKKTGLLLEACQSRRPTTYLPVDVSREMLESSGTALCAAVPGLTVIGLWGRYEAGLARLCGEEPGGDGPLAVAFLGSNLGNTTPTEREALLAEIAATLRPGDAFLVSVDLLKPGAVFESCYNDPPGETAFAWFRLNHLVHLNHRFGSALRPADFRPYAFYNAAGRAVEGHLVALTDQWEPVPGLGLTLTLRRDETINVGFSAKFDHEDFVDDLAGHGLGHEAEWVDPELKYAIFLFRR